MHPEITRVAAQLGLSAEDTAVLDSVVLELVERTAPRSVLNEAGEDFSSVWLDATDETVDDVREPGQRYQDLGLLGEGGMGEVRRVRDLELNRILAMKILHAGLLSHPRAMARFVEEAQATSQLQHPNIVPIYDIGVHDDGRAWFTMREVRGRTMGEVIAEVHAASGYAWETGRTGWTFRRLIDVFLQVCRAVGYAHERGVVHRDLKPENVMIGEHGEVTVLDWGLAKVLGRAERPVITERALSGVFETRVGTVSGTPVYMSPEQARGEVDRIGPRSDVHGLGAMLFQVLTARPPYTGEDVVEVVGRVGLGHREPLPDSDRIPTELAAVCERALSFEPSDRYATAREVALEVEAWLDGAHKREQAEAIVERALQGVDRAATLRAEAAAKRVEADRMLEGVPAWGPEEDKASGWATEAEAERLERDANRAELAVDHGLQAALRVVPDLPSAHAALGERFRARHALAESRRDLDAMLEHRAAIELHGEALPPQHPDRARLAAYLKGDGALSLVTEPPGAEVELFRYVEHDRRLVAEPMGVVGTSPLVEIPLAMGSYLCVIRSPGRAPVRYPIEVPRLGHWDGVAPDQTEPTPIWLPPDGWLDEGSIYVPAGWFRSGGDPQASTSLPAARLWCEGFVIHRHTVTNRRFLAFLDDLVAQGRLDEAMAAVPRERGAEDGAAIYAFDGTRFSLQPDADGDVWDPDWPVLMVDWRSARAYLAWLAERTGRDWRLPDELEWEKAARGVDGRWYPWGDFLDPTWCCMSESHATRRLPSVVTSFEVDESPYGVRGMGGNAQDWCRTAIPGPVAPDGVPLRVVIRGGAWDYSARVARCANRGKSQTHGRAADMSFRGAYALPSQLS